MGGLLFENKRLEEIQSTNINDFFRAAKDFCNNNKKESFVLSRRIANINKKDLIIFEADINKIDLNILNLKKEQVLKLPTNNIFIEIPKWIIKREKYIMQNLGGLYIFEEFFGERKVITLQTYWLIFDGSERIILKPWSCCFMDEIRYNEQQKLFKMKAGSKWNWDMAEAYEIMNEEEKEEITYNIMKILYFLIVKIEKKDYTTYKKWHPSGMETKEIVYDREVCTHKRHFWEDSGRFIIPKLGKEEWEKQGYGTHELVFKDGELRRDVPYKLIGNFLVEGSKGQSANNRRIELAKGRIFRQEEKLGRILFELYPNQFIKRHDRKAVKPLELDFYIKELNLAFEYDGEQHYDKKLCEEVFGSDFNELQKRDRKKEVLCRNKGIRLIRIKYDEPLGINLIKRKLKQ
jgi:very-short-patch-repair endonuclease